MLREPHKTSHSRAGCCARLPHHNFNIALRIVFTSVPLQFEVFVSDCQFPFEQIGQGCYFYDQSLYIESFSAAVDFCNSLLGHLVIVNDGEENRALLDFLEPGNRECITNWETDTGTHVATSLQTRYERRVVLVCFSSGRRCSSGSDEKRARSARVARRFSCQRWVHKTLHGQNIERLAPDRLCEGKIDSRKNPNWTKLLDSSCLRIANRCLHPPQNEWEMYQN